MILMTTKKEELIKLIDGTRFFEKAYDVMRIIDPIKNRILSYRENRIIETKQTCYQYWSKEKSCDNCISIKAYKENDTFIKLEYFKKRVHMVSAIPVVKNGETVVIELLKDVTNKMFVFKKDEVEAEVDVHSIINNTNELLLRDHLTGVFNRRYIDERLQGDIINNALNKRSLSLIMADIDFFKNINDTYGHITGDYVLKEIASILVSSIRKGRDWIARYGGEEFLICLPNTEKDVSSKIAERMRTKIEERIFEYEGEKFKLTTSFGAYTIDASDDSEIESILNTVDKNLYKAKQNGRNMVVSS